jgi:hypothetical protein
MLDTNLILIGPLAAGKSSIGKLLGDALGVPVLELDELRWRYYAEIGYDPERAEQLRRNGGIKARSVYWKPFEIYCAERGEGKLKLCIYKMVRDTCGNGSHAFTFTRVEGDWVADEVWEIATCLRH